MNTLIMRHCNERKLLSRVLLNVETAVIIHHTIKTFTRSDKTYCSMITDEYVYVCIHEGLPATANKRDISTEIITIIIPLRNIILIIL